MEVHSYFGSKSKQLVTWPGDAILRRTGAPVPGDTLKGPLPDGRLALFDGRRQIAVYERGRGIAVGPWTRAGVAGTAGGCALLLLLGWGCAAMIRRRWAALALWPPPRCAEELEPLEAAIRSLRPLRVRLARLHGFLFVVVGALAVVVWVPVTGALLLVWAAVFEGAMTAAQLRRLERGLPALFEGQPHRPNIDRLLHPAAQPAGGAEGGLSLALAASGPRGALSLDARSAALNGRLSLDRTTDEAAGALSMAAAGLEGRLSTAQNGALLLVDEQPLNPSSVE